MLYFVPSDLSQQRLIREGVRVGYLACEAAGFRYVLIKRSSVEREQVQFLAYDFLLERCDLPNQICNRLWRERERERRDQELRMHKNTFVFLSVQLSVS